MALLPHQLLIHQLSFQFHGCRRHSSNISASISLSSFFNDGLGLCPSFSISSLQLKKLHIQGRRPFDEYESSFQVSYRYSSQDDDEEGGGEGRFDEAVALFNEREYYKCHDFLESLWNTAEEPRRTLFHGILQCAVGFHHLLSNNHKGAMMELGEGLCKLRKMNFESGPFYCFEQDISAALDFIYHTQIELAACSEDICVTMDRSERSYQLLGGYAAGQDVYRLQQPGPDQTTYIVFSPAPMKDEEEEGSATARGHPQRVKLPLLNATQADLPQLD